MINGKQITVTWHVDDLKVSHIDSFQNTKFIAYLATIYGEGLSVHQGKVHDYLGMDFNFATDGIAHVSMITYTSKIITDLPELITTSCAVPASDHLFTVRNESKAKFLPIKTSPSLPPHGHPAPVPQQTIPERHTDSRLLPHNTRKTPR